MKIRKGKCFIHEKYKNIFDTDAKYLGVTLPTDLKLKGKIPKQFERKFSIKKKIEDSPLFHGSVNHSLIEDNLLFIMLTESKSGEDFYEALCDLKRIVVEKKIEKIAIHKSSLTQVRGQSYKKTLRMLAALFEDTEIEFIVCKSMFAPFVLLSLFILLGFGAGCLSTNKEPIPLIIDDKDKIDEPMEQQQEYIKIPGFSEITVTKDTPNVQLYNCEGNTVYFSYTITQPLSDEVVGTYDSMEKAQEYINGARQSYEHYYDGANDKYLLKNSAGECTDVLTEYKMEENGSGYDVVKCESKVLFFTDAISPGKSSAKDWNAYESLDSGEHDIQFRISTFDIETHESCSSSTVNVSVTVK